MKDFFKTFILPLAIVFTTISCSEDKSNAATAKKAESTATTTQNTTKKEALALLYYADWCGSCKVLDPMVNQAKSAIGSKVNNIEFVKFDLTDDNTKAASRAVAESLGVVDIYDANKGKTGYMAMVDADSKQIISKINKLQSIDEIKSSLIAAAAGN